MKNTVLSLLFFLLCSSLIVTGQNKSILVLTETAGWNHKTKEATDTMFRNLLSGSDIKMYYSDSSEEYINSKILEEISILVLANTTGDIFTPEEQLMVQNFVENGGAILSIHAGGDTEYQWEWYMNALGAHFITHAKDGERPAKLLFENTDNPSTKALQNPETITEEWYTFNRSPRNSVIVLAALDESSYIKDSTEMGWFDQRLQMGDHPIIWYNRIGNGIVFYTGLGHGVKTYSKEYFIDHIKETISWLFTLKENKK